MNYITIGGEKDKEAILEILKKTYDKEETKKMPYGNAVVKYIDKYIREFEETGKLAEILALRLLKIYDNTKRIKKI
jgi:hypothetical protein